MGQLVNTFCILNVTFCFHFGPLPHLFRNREFSLFLCMRLRVWNWLCAILYYYMLLYPSYVYLFFYVDLVCTSMYGMHSTMLSFIFYIILLRACFFYCAQPECFVFFIFCLYACLLIFFLRSFCLWWIDFVHCAYSYFFIEYFFIFCCSEDLNKNWQIL